MSNSLVSKTGLKTGARTHLAGAPADIAELLGASGARLVGRLSGSFDHIHAFFTASARLDRRFPTLKHHLKAGGALWISWPKGGQLDTDLSMTRIIEMGYRHGLVESKAIGVDPTWSAIKFTFPKKGKTYRNSFGTLPPAEG